MLDSLSTRLQGVFRSLRGEVRLTEQTVEVALREIRMLELHAADPRYGFDRHKGYATREHLQAVAQFGYSPVHRQSFRPPSLFDKMS